MSVIAINTRSIVFVTLVFSCVVASSSMNTALNNVHCAPEETTINVAVPTCQERRNLKVKRCIGTCLSYSLPDHKTGLMVNTCQCCKALTTKIMRVYLYCRDPRDGKIVAKPHDIKSAEKCACLPC